ncbi:hypothetical protein QV01_03010 [Gallibacterium genomosp. 3]|uniref:DUF4325 domain-containing protein n=1 Tax=Gallibacterium genomosp. 3 TaxID=505345 RepID=A0A1A7NV01_9PAST|nr:STAS-like domain-containing protein [Gallibacterium genomosp. 3]OBW93326.1 hypothetical protein QV01_03010 [Gallibacterium genomosp. 3]
MNNTITVCFPTGHLATRKSAIPYRDQIIKAIDDNSLSIIIDLSQTEGMSTSFADECIGILVKIYGWDIVKEKIRISGGNPSVAKTIATAILDRKNLES